jgi:hypothetical protein
MHRTINNYPSHGSVASSSILPPLVDYHYHPKSMIYRMATHWYECAACTVARKSLEQPTSPSWWVELTDTRGIVKFDGHDSGHGVILLSWSRDDGSSSSIVVGTRARGTKHQNENSKERKRFIGEFKICLNLAILTFSNLNSVHLYRGIIIRNVVLFPRLRQFKAFSQREGFSNLNFEYQPHVGVCRYIPASW